MGYSNNPAMVRVDFFKESGKWYATESIEFKGYSAPIIQDAFISSLVETLTYTPEGETTPRIRYGGMNAVCLEPYHSHAFPLMMRVPTIDEVGKG